MKKFYLATATVQHGAYQYLDAYPLPEHIGQPTYYQCVDVVLDFWFEDEDDPSGRIQALQELSNHNHAWLPCGERVISDIGYDLDHRRMVEYQLEHSNLLSHFEALFNELAHALDGHSTSIFCKDTDTLCDLMLLTTQFIEYLQCDDPHAYLQNWIKNARHLIPTPIGETTHE